VEFELPSYDHIVLSNLRIVARYGGVGHHVLNGGPLHNALNLCSGPIFDHDAFPTLEEKAAKIGHAISTGHVFSDANKRTAASAMDLVLELNDHALTVPEGEHVATMYALANGQMTYEQWLFRV